MTPYEEDLQYAKKILSLINAFLSGAMLKDPKIGYSELINFEMFHIPRTDSSRATVLTVSKVHSTTIDAFRDVADDDCFSFESLSDACWIHQELYKYNEHGSWDLEEEHFQNSLILSPLDNRRFLVLKYINEFLPKDYTYMCIYTEYLDRMFAIYDSLQTVQEDTNVSGK